MVSSGIVKIVVSASVIPRAKRLGVTVSALLALEVLVEDLWRFGRLQWSGKGGEEGAEWYSSKRDEDGVW